MWFWWFMVICDLLLPINMLITGRMMWKHYPKEINGVLGYRTNRSMKNANTWKFAHEYCGKLWWKIGAASVLPTILVHIPFFHSDENIIGIVGGIVAAVQCVIMLASVFLTEHALKKTFNADGTRIA